ncbi:unnamed protein product [Trypanosoma congolense IL3000]|uniref:WGS project CAEQ00000000 data, annotated contig 2391 n=1 Tax=Trypanosoma congolense (strain IL3000) TaxID=1068625 RepID=F9WDQ8_TRYCI|nr:unnamed protein product [Trypanosoma congolense IL3000]
MGDCDNEYREATNPIEAFIDCARYDEPGDADEVRTLLSGSPSFVNVQDEQGRTALHAAAANGRMDMLEILLSYGPTPDATNNEGNTALHFAALNNQVEAARLLLKNGWRASARNTYDKTPIQLIYGKQFEEMELLLLGFDEELDNLPATVSEAAGCADNVETSAASQQVPQAAGQGAGEFRTHEEVSTVADSEGSPAKLLGSVGVDEIE